MPLHEVRVLSQGRISNELLVAVATLAAAGWGGSGAEAPDTAVFVRVSAQKEVFIARARASTMNINVRRRGERNGPTAHDGIWSPSAAKINVVLNLARRGRGTRL
jgi:hypothetical protein